MRRAEMSLNWLVYLVIIGVLLGIFLFFIVPQITGGTKNFETVNRKLCSVGLNQGRCQVAQEQGSGWNCVQLGCDGDYCCYCSSVSDCFGAQMLLKMGETEYRFADTASGSNLKLESGTYDLKTLSAQGGLSASIPFTVRYMPLPDETTCELVIADGAHQKSFGQKDCAGADNFVYLAGQERLVFNELADESGNSICGQEGSACKVFFKLMTNGKEKNSFTVYFER